MHPDHFSLADTIQIAQSYLASRRSETDSARTSPTVSPSLCRYCRVRMPKQAFRRSSIDALISKLDAIEVNISSRVRLHSWAWIVLPSVDKPSTVRERIPAPSSVLDNSFTSAANVLRSSSEWQHVRAAYTRSWDLHVATSYDTFQERLDTDFVELCLCITYVGMPSVEADSEFAWLRPWERACTRLGLRLLSVSQTRHNT